VRNWAPTKGEIYAQNGEYSGQKGKNQAVL